MNTRSRTRSRRRTECARIDEVLRHQALRRIERDSFILIQHAYALSGGNRQVLVNPHRLLCDLGFTEDEITQLLRYLSWVGYLRDAPGTSHLTLSEEAVTYLEHERGRRCSVRCDAEPEGLEAIGISR